MGMVLTSRGGKKVRQERASNRANSEHFYASEERGVEDDVCSEMADVDAP